MVPHPRATRILRPLALAVLAGCLLAPSAARAGGALDDARAALAVRGIQAGLMLLEAPIRRLTPAGRWVMPREFVVTVPFTERWELVPGGFDASSYPREDPWRSVETPTVGVGFRF